MRAMLEAAGYRVHVYTSPHLVRFNERIRLAGEIIGDEALLRTLDICEAANAEQPITFFEITTAAAFVAFAEVPADILLLEVGLGGRFDATNVVDRPLLTAITPVSIDHRQYLGDTLTEIAGEKAGILKPGVPAVIAPQTAEAARAIAAEAARVGVPLIRGDHEWRVEPAGDGFNYVHGDRILALPRPVLPGGHQFTNAGTAIACIDDLPGFTVPETAIRDGLATASWPARMQRLRAGPLVASLPEGWALWLDGGHNPSAGEALAAVLGGWRDQPVHLVVGMLDTKDNAGFLRPLAPLAAGVQTVTIPTSPASVSAEALAASCTAAGMLAAPSPSVDAAVRSIVAEPGPASRILICGSLYLAGAVLAENR